MAIAFYVDEDVPLSVAETLIALGYDARTVRDLGRKGNPDNDQFNLAVQNGWTFVIHNGRDFLKIHRVWRDWVVPHTSLSHAGIILIPQRYALSGPQMATEIDRYCRTNPQLTDRMVEWTRQQGFTDVVDRLLS